MAKHILDAKHLDKCGHGGCTCLIDPGQSYCSEFCEKADSKNQKNPPEAVKACGCGHSDCK